MSTQSQARTIIAKLVEKPDLFAEVVRIIKDEYEFASPWAKEGDHWVRTDLAGLSYMAQVAPNIADGDTYSWVTDSDHGVADSEVKAKAAADKVLRESGITLPIFDQP